MTKRERVIAAIGGGVVDAVPSCFSLHFPSEEASGEAGIKSHLDFFRRTDTDILKIMNENLLPDVGDIRIPADWKKIPSYSSKSPFLVEQIEFAKRILEKCDASAFTLGTLHGICASAIHPIERRYGYQAVRELQVAHLRENPRPVLDAFGRITEGLCLLARAYAELGIDGVYYAALGAERELFTDEEFASWIAPFDQRILREVKSAGCRAFLHMCKGNLNLRRYAGYFDLADVVNWGVEENGFSLEEGRALFGGACVMGGLANRSGVLVEGTEEDLRRAVKGVIRGFGKTRFILGADCTLPTGIPYERIRVAVEAAR
jgi:uroporphyrinogen decarboxylase